MPPVRLVVWRTGIRVAGIGCDQGLSIARRREGTVVNVASLAGRNGFAGGTAYAASKHGVLGFSRSLMLEVRKEGIRVVTICPGSVDTGMLRGQPMLKPGRKGQRDSGELPSSKRHSAAMLHLTSLYCDSDMISRAEPGEGALCETRKSLSRKYRTA